MPQRISGCTDRSGRLNGEQTLPRWSGLKHTSRILRKRHMPVLPELLPAWAAPLIGAPGAPRLGSAALVARLRAALQDGALPPGASLPTSRGLAEQLEISRNTVVAAYAQLMLEGWL